MKKYLTYFVTTMKMNTAYKADYLLSLLLDAVFFFISFAVWKIVFSEGNIDTINTYSLRDTITYFFVTAILFRLDVSGSIYLGWQIWSGYFTNDLIKPWSITMVSVIDTIAEKTFMILLYIPVAITIFIVAHDYILLPNSQNVLFFIISVALAFFMAVMFNLIFHALTFHYGDQDSNIELFNYIAIFLAGASFPLAFLPHNIAVIFEMLPFKNMFFVPIEIFLGKMEPSAIYRSWLETIVWTIIFYLVFKLIYKKGLKHYTGTGR
jgi:ABC-2 type transport system permease protein